MSCAVLFKLIWRDIIAARRGLFLFALVFKLVQAWLLVPALAWMLAVLLARSGRLAVSNRDIVDFFISPTGLIYAALMSISALAMLLLEQAGFMMVTAFADLNDRPPWRQVVRAIAGKVWKLFQMGAILVGLLTLLLGITLLLSWVVFVILLSEHDFYFYWKERPPIFWLAGGMIGLLLGIAAAVVLWLYVRWALALPILLFENQPPRKALRASRDRMRGVGWRVGIVLGSWLGIVLGLGIILELGFHRVAGAVLEHAGPRPILSLVLLLLVQGALVAVHSFFLVAGFSLLTRRLYLIRGEQLGLTMSEAWKLAEARPASPWNGRLALLALVVLLLTPLALGIDLSRYVKNPHHVRVTAHRGHARAAPENTLSAFQKAIASGADYVEMDVQLTADGVIVLLHDRDLMRVAGDSRRLDELSLAELRRLDVGAWFDAAFAGERVPTLEEVIDLCRGKIRLNIELKFYGQDRGLVQAVAQLLHKVDVESECLITSMNYDALAEIKKQNPRLRTGLIIAHALGNVSRLDVAALSVRADFLSPDLQRSAQGQGQEVHVWTINDPQQMAQMFHRGVDNLITSDPDLALQVRGELSDLTQAERLLLVSRLLLGLNP